MYMINTYVYDIYTYIYMDMYVYIYRYVCVYIMQKKGKIYISTNAK